MKRLLSTAQLLLLLLLASSAFAGSQYILPHTGLTADQVALIINEDDPLSRQVGAYYTKVRAIPPGNVIRVHFTAGRAALSKDDFIALKQQIDDATPSHVQAYAVAWTEPYRAGCMSLTSALAFGYDEHFCSTQCGATAASPYFDSPSRYPAVTPGLRPAMLLAGRGFAEVKALIDRGLASDSSFPQGRAYMLNTTDKARNVRAAHFAQTARELAGVFPVDVLATNAIADRQDVLFYFTGLPRVPKINTLGFLPGALADHLTSFGGQLSSAGDAAQMSSLRWLEAGATASYGTVIEPCNHPQKFPLPAVAMFHYASGETAIEAYWKSVAWPSEGVFIGEPLARPFAPMLRAIAGVPDTMELHLFSPRVGKLQIAVASSPMGPYHLTDSSLPIRRGTNRLRLPKAPPSGFVKLMWP